MTEAIILGIFLILYLLMIFEYGIKPILDLQIMQKINRARLVNKMIYYYEPKISEEEIKNIPELTLQPTDNTFGLDGKVYFCLELRQHICEKDGRFYTILKEDISNDMKDCIYDMLNNKPVTA